MVVAQVGKVVGEVAEVVADADLQVLPDVTIDRGKRTASTLADVRQGKCSRFNHALPALAEPPIPAQHHQLRGVVEEVQLRPIKAYLSHTVGVLAADRPVGSDVEGQVDRCDVTLLNELRGSVQQGHLIRGRDVIEIRVLSQRVQPVVSYWTIRVADYRLRVTASVKLTQ